MVPKLGAREKTFPSRRSVVMSRNGMVATSQPLAAQAGVRMLLEGGNAIDAAIAASAALNVVEPMSTGIGGDLFALIYLAGSKRVRALNASGRSPYAANLDYFSQRGLREIPLSGMMPVTVPGTVDGWATMLEEHGTMGLPEVLRPAIEYAEDGFPVTEVISALWRGSVSLLAAHPSSAKAYLIDGRAPLPGEVFKQPDLAKTLRMIADGGRDVFYRGEIAEVIIRFSQENGGLLSLRDFAEHTSTWVEPISTDYRGYDVYECPPNDQGLTVLLALNIVEGFDLALMEHNSAEHLHPLIEALKLAFADAQEYVADPDFAEIPIGGLLSKAYADEQRARIDEGRAAGEVLAGVPPSQGDTVYITVVDEHRNAVSLMNSLFWGFGSGMVVEGTGICLHNRGALFSLDADHRNRLEPHKRPYHTIIPSMVLKDDELFMSFGVMGGFMQPQGQLQVLVNILDFGMNVQSALDAPRFRYVAGRQVSVEEGIGESTRRNLSKRGHEIVPLETTPMSLGGFGGGQVIMVDPAGVLLAGSDPRKDGFAIGF
ncbi:MAG: gamma-glutamyltransferase [Candidatus Geothermarchaeales archaeon]